MKVIHEQLEAALQQCRETLGTSPTPCLTPEYLAARAHYHRLLVESGMLDPKLADVARPGVDSQRLHRLRGETV